ncbi:MAG: amidophosphoribosyltransferase [Oscillospiraceae bacterium]|nr:amidophosphoribosyltransferase [Oscillospiraceae bacterium]
MDKFREECGLVAAVLKGNVEAAQTVYFGLNGLQHRGQQSAGLAVCNDGIMSCYKDTGLVTEVLDEKILTILKGDMALGHVKYGPGTESFQIHAQPLLINYRHGSLATAFNGALVNGNQLRERMENDGAIFSTTTDCEVVAALIARYDKNDITEAVKATMEEIQGGYALCIMTKDRIIGARDPRGIRPLSIGKLSSGYALASESCAFDMMEGEFIRDVKPGEIIIIENENITSVSTGIENEKAMCSFEYVYFARPDSTIDGKNVYDVRELAGRALAAEHPVDADVIIGVPDSGTPAAIGYSLESGIPYRPGLIKNKYIGRIFIQPTQTQREIGVRIKLNPIEMLVKDKSVVLVDDSIVRGTTMRKIIATLRHVGAKEVHLRISSPPIRNCCYFGVDTPDIKDFIATSRPVEEIRQELDADSLGFISIEGLLKSLGGTGYCTGCFSGEYPMDIGINYLPTFRIAR